MLTPWRKEWVVRRHGLTLSHVAITSNRAPFASGMTDTSRRQANQTNSVFQLRLAVKLQQSDIVVERLAIVIVVDVRRRDAQGLSARTSVLTSEIVIAHSHVDRVSGPHDAGNERASSYFT